MKRLSIGIFLGAVLAIPAQGQTLIFEEDFEGGAADWADVTYSVATHNPSGGHDGGAYISVTADIDTTSGGNFGGYTVARCADGPNQAPLLSCSGGGFVGDWYFGDFSPFRAVQVLSFWFRHNSAKPGGIIPQVRVAVAGNQRGGSGVFPVVLNKNSVAGNNGWTKLVLEIDPQNPEWDSNWGQLVPNAVEILRRVGRIQPGYYVDPNDPVYSESGVTFEIDDVQILGTTSIPAVVSLDLPAGNKKNKIHPHHNGPSAIAGLDDPIPVVVYGASIGAGDPNNLNTDNIDSSTVRVGILGGPQNGFMNGQAVGPDYNLDEDSDGQDDARFATKTSTSGYDCAYLEDDTVALRGELTTGEIVAGEVAGVSFDCNAGCHNEAGY